jgi:hypothetical protein
MLIPPPPYEPEPEPEPERQVGAADGREVGSCGTGTGATSAAQHAPPVQRQGRRALLNPPRACLQIRKGLAGLAFSPRP